MELGLVLLGLLAIPLILVVIFVKIKESGDRNIDWNTLRGQADYFTKRTNCRIALMESKKAIFVRGYAGGLSGKVHDVEYSFEDIRSFTRNRGNNALILNSTNIERPEIWIHLVGNELPKWEEIIRQKVLNNI